MSSFEPFIPASATLRELTIVAQHGELKYPEGTACAEVLKAGASEEVFAPFDAASISIENDPALLGVGYIIGPRIASLMAGGGVLSYLVLIPAIKYFGSGLAAPIAPEAARLIKEMSVEDIQGAYVLYIAAGAASASFQSSSHRSFCIWSDATGSCENEHLHSDGLAHLPQQ